MLKSSFDPFSDIMSLHNTRNSTVPEAVEPNTSRNFATSESISSLETKLLSGFDDLTK